MVISAPWLKEFLPNLDWGVSELCENLTSIGHETKIIDKTHLEVDITPNRGDCNSVFGLARDLAGIYNLLLVQPTVDDLPKNGNFINLKINHKLKDQVTYDLLVEIENYQTQDSPPEIVDKLTELGLAHKDLIVDLTNIIAYEIGSPLHAFDFQKISNGLELDLSSNNEEIALLDGRSVKLPANCLIQRSASQVVDLAGIMGGLNSAVTDTTNHAVLQAAVFDPSLVRSSSKLSNVASAASLQYQKGVSSFTADLGLKRFLHLLRKYKPQVKVNCSQRLTQDKSVTGITIDLKKINTLIGYDFRPEDLTKLTKLGFVCQGETVIPPQWRLDVSNTPELAEEMARVIGLNKIGTRELKKVKLPQDCDFRRLQTLKQQLKNIGLTETSGYSFSDMGEIEIANPLNKDEKFIRTSLKDSLVTTVSRNPYMKKVCYFEIGHVFPKQEVPKIGFIMPTFDKSLVTKINEVLGENLNYEFIEETELKKKNVKLTQVNFAETELGPVLSRIRTMTELDSTLKKYQPISKYPPVVRDISLLVDNSIKSSTIVSILSRNKSVLLAEQTDSFQSDKLGRTKTSLTYRILLQNMDRSLTDAEADRVLRECLNSLSKEVQFTLR